MVRPSRTQPRGGGPPEGTRSPLPLANTCPANAALMNCLPSMIASMAGRSSSPASDFENVAARPRLQRGFSNVPCPVPAHEQDFRIWRECEDSSSDFDTVERRKPDVQQRQIRFERFRLLNRFQSISGFTDDLALKVPKRRRDIAAPRLVIVDHQNPDGHSSHRGAYGRSQLSKCSEGSSPRPRLTAAQPSIRQASSRVP